MTSWTNREEKIVRDVYVTRGLRVTAALLPRHTASGVQGRARLLGCMVSRDQWIRRAELRFMIKIQSRVFG